MASLEHIGASELAYLSSFSGDGDKFYYKVAQTTNDAKPLFEGTIAEFVSANPTLTDQMRNIAKKCAACGKSCASILPFCNGCDRDLSDAALEYTENVCMGFIYGIQRAARYELKLSMRFEAEDVLVYDDLLARSSCHLNAIPSYCHLPDWRHLLRNPAKGIKLMERLDEACWQVTEEQFWNNDSWRASLFREGAFSSAADFRKQVHAGLNSVPSQFQVHLQYIVPPIGPSDYHQFLHGKRFVKDRWLPLEYVMQSLTAVSQSSEGSLPNAHNMSMEDIFDAIWKLGGPRYQDMYAQAIRRYNRTHRICANWKPELFDVSVIIRHPTLRPELFGAAGDATSFEEVQDAEVRPLKTDVAAASMTRTQLEKKDKAAIQSYGRPYDAEGRPVACSFYRFAREPGSVQSADQWASPD